MTSDSYRQIALDLIEMETSRVAHVGGPFESCAHLQPFKDRLKTLDAQPSSSSMSSASTSSLPVVFQMSNQPSDWARKRSRGGRY